MINSYYLMEDGKQTGPFTHQELTESELAPTSLILSPLNEHWQDAIDLPEFSTYFAELGILYPSANRLSNFWWRLLAYAIDYVIVILLLVLFGAVSAIVFTVGGGDTDGTGGDSDLIFKLMFVVVLILYNSVLECSPLRGSFGKAICQLAVVDENGAGLSFSNALGRNAGKIGSGLFLGFGYLQILWNARRQGWHDQWARAFVVHRNK